MTRRARVLLVALAAVAAVTGNPNTASAAAQPSVSIDRNTVHLGETIIVTLDGWPSQRAVVISICGNGARRGTADCDLKSSQGYGIRDFDELHRTQFVIAAPPVPCPCVIQVTNSTQSEVAFAPITIAGFPTGPPLENTFTSAIETGLSVRRAKSSVFGWLRSWVGGPTSYVVTVDVHNQLGEELNDIKVRVRAGRSAGDQARRITVPTIKSLPAGGTWTHSQKVTLSAPVLGRFVWTATASGAGPLARTTTDARHRPIGLYLLVFVFVADVAWYVGRRISRRRSHATSANV